MSQKAKDKLLSKIGGEPQVQSFIKKTFDILEEQKYADVISWSEDGASIVIKNSTAFAQKVLPIYFKHNNLTSFVRQLNMYNFHKRKSKNGEQTYTHELFQRGRRHLLKEIQRKNTENTISNLEKSLAGIEATKSNDDPIAVNQENMLLKKLNKESLLKIYSLENKIKDINKQNLTLWKKIYEKQEKMDLLKFSFVNFLKENGVTENDIPQNLRGELKQQEIQLLNEKISEPSQNFNTDNFFSNFNDPAQQNPFLMFNPWHLGNNPPQFQPQHVIPNQQNNDFSNPFENNFMNFSQHNAFEDEKIDAFDMKSAELEKFYSHNSSDTTNGSCSATSITDEDDLKV